MGSVMKRCNCNLVYLRGLHPFMGVSVELELPHRVGYHLLNFDSNCIKIFFFAFRVGEVRK